ncbi:hypothetical protein H310_09891 [Aphanomyces invadans]|uniref:FYVE-type domain-containing protein n=1 Tax=Aphanomyces invadans TaxID=157072 RepID=A0A024TSU0_9STRA|nr:hypothetical protein H310_09891 [Aphanomyces invadans]ETV97069.1 hypothetical protein H310_09891 [Aphanomyces invadans]|eukprot:XP_008874315.1 hypothetical protein H310_09891 [Aphanomyces invadans]
MGTLRHKYNIWLIETVLKQLPTVAMAEEGIAEGCVGLDPELADELSRAEAVVSILLSRLHCDPVSVDSAVWPLHNWESLLWALSHQARHGSCDDCRGQPDYENFSAASKMHSARPWYASCCAGRLGRDSYMKKWELLGAMAPGDAAAKYLDIVSDVLPGWDATPGPDVALLAEWTADASSYCCSNCGEGFTLLNRRHHCRRCSKLVCAPCSSTRLALRLFPGQPLKIQRVCNGCVSTMNPQVRSTLEKGLPLPPSSYTSESGQATTESRTATVLSVESAEGDPSPQDDAVSRTTHAGMKAVPKQSLIKRGYVERMIGSRFQKRWEKFFLVLLVRKGSVGIYTHEDDMAPMEVYKLAGYSIRVKSEKRRPHQFKVEHPILTPMRLCVTSLREMNEWITAFSQAIDASNASELLRG